MTNTHHSDVLYVFLHILKTAGTTFRYHLEQNLPAHALLPVDMDGTEYIDVRTGARCYFDTREDVDTYLSTLTKEQRNSLSVIYGHDVYYGIHRFFEKPVRYVTFFREPVAQRLSFYNFYRVVLEDAPPYPYDAVDVRRRQFLQETRRDLYDGSALLTFERWLSERSWHKNYVTSFLRQRGFLEQDGIVANALKKFYFIGTTEHFNTDVLFLYRLLGIRCLFGRQNVSRSYAHPSNTLIHTILEQNQEDVALYREACAVNRRRRWHHIAYDMTIVYVRWAMASGPRLAHRAFGYGYRVSTWLRRRSRVYSTILDQGKTLIWRK